MRRAAFRFPTFGALLACASASSCADVAATHVAPSLTSNRSAVARARTTDLSGSWKYLPYSGEGDMGAPVVDDSGWPTMSRPSNWFLLRQKDDPPAARAFSHAFGNNAPGELWPVDPKAGLDYAGTVWFRRTLDLPHAPAADEPMLLDLDMVDYYADVFVNGVAVGRHEGYFQHWSVDATSALHAGSNVIAVKVSAPALEFDMSQQFPVSWPKMQNQIKGIFGYHDTRPGATSWRGQERSTGGILRGIALRPSAGVDLVDVTVTPLDVSETSARLVVDATLQNWSSAPRSVTLDGVIRPSNFKDAHSFNVHTAVQAAPGRSHARTEIVVDHPHLWWSWDYGHPDLYQLEANLSDPKAGGPPLDERTVRFGVRSITLDSDWVFHLNGKRIYPRGTNYIATQWLSQADRGFYERDLRLMVDANLNSLRVHAHLERPELYDLADELGLLVWQDFPLQWGYTDMPSFRAEALRQAEDMIREYGDHPSIVLWCMHNESPHAMAWMQHRDPSQNLALDEALTALAKKLDPSRVVHRDSGTGDGHYYYGWYDGTLPDVAKAKVVPLVTEYGAAALPAVETLRTMFDADALWPDTPRDWETWQFADFQPKNTFELARVSQGHDIEEFVHNTQRYQATVVRYTTEVFRRRKWQGGTGIYQFMFSDDWPSITWSVLDYYRRPKLAFGALKESMQRLLPSLEYAPDDPTKPITLYVVNDFTNAFPGAKAKWTLKRSDGTEKKGERALDIAADSVARVAELGSMPELSDARARLDVTVVNGKGETLGHASLQQDDFLERRTN
ncbi:MAG TPA: glycoside hydrolase family 2 TIM barrel-domain containing protein [Polyangiaceae bacterium]